MAAPFQLASTLGLLSLSSDPSPISGIEAYWNTSIGAIRAYNGAAWVTIGPAPLWAEFLSW